MFADTVSTNNSSVVQNLDRDQFFHVVRESDLPRPRGAPMIQIVELTPIAGLRISFSAKLIHIFCGSSLLHTGSSQDKFC